MKSIPNFVLGIYTRKNPHVVQYFGDEWDTIDNMINDYIHSLTDTLPSLVKLYGKLKDVPEEIVTASNAELNDFTFINFLIEKYDLSTTDLSQAVILAVLNNSGYHDLAVKRLLQITGIIIVEIEFIIENLMKMSREERMDQYVGDLNQEMHRGECFGIISKKMRRHFNLRENLTGGLLSRKVAAVQDELDYLWDCDQVTILDDGEILLMSHHLVNAVMLKQKKIPVKNIDSVYKIKITPRNGPFDRYRKLADSSVSSSMKNYYMNMDFFFERPRRTRHIGKWYRLTPSEFLTPVSLRFYLSQQGFLNEMPSIDLEVIVEDVPVISIEM
jgi:hypothetical protein